MKSHSQAGQDLFVNAVLNGKQDGRFIDIGCSHPVQLSNTYALESELGWRGVLVDVDQASIDLCRAQRKAVALCINAAAVDWVALREITGEVCDYASVDVDEHTHKALRRLLDVGPACRVLTCEHDFYARGDRLRLPNRDLLKRNGYELIAADVHSLGCCFEDWYVMPNLVDMVHVDRFRCVGLDWAYLLQNAGVKV